MQNYKTKNGKRKVNVSAFYDKDRKWKIIVPTSVYNYLEEQIKETVPFKNFKKDEAYYFLSLIFYIQARKKDKVYNEGFVTLHSKLLEDASYKYKKYFDFFCQIELIERSGNYLVGKRSKRYRYNYQKIWSEEQPIFEFKMLEFDNSKFNNKMSRFDSRGLKNCSYLTKWIHEGLEIDVIEAKKTIEENLKMGKEKFTYSEIHEIESKAYNYNYSMMSIHHNIFFFSRKRDRDNRLHTNLTNMPKILRKHITYLGEPIKSLDIKNSQPYFLVLLIERIKEERVIKVLEDILKLESIYDYAGIMFEKIVQILCQKEFQSEYAILKDWILDGVFYEHLEDYYGHISVNEKTGKYEMMFFNFNKGYQEKLSFNTKRDLMKKLTLQILYTPLINPSKEYVVFKTAFPNFTKFIESFKTLNSDDKDSYKLFPKILQHVEADCVIDYVCKNLSETYPDMPLWTIHDSICTTEQWFDCMQEEVNILLKRYTGNMLPQIKVENWS